MEQTLNIQKKYILLNVINWIFKNSFTKLKPQCF